MGSEKEREIHTNLKTTKYYNETVFKKNGEMFRHLTLIWTLCFQQLLILPGHQEPKNILFVRMTHSNR